MKSIFYSLFPQNRRESKKFNIKLSLLFTSTQNGKIFPNDFFGSSDNHSSLPLIIPDHVNKKEFNQRKNYIEDMFNNFTSLFETLIKQEKSKTK